MLPLSYDIPFTTQVIRKTQCGPKNKDGIKALEDILKHSEIMFNIGSAVYNKEPETRYLRKINFVKVVSCS